MAVSARLLTVLSASAEKYMNGLCTIYGPTDGINSAGNPTKTFSTQRVGNTYPVKCSLQEIPQRERDGESAQKLEYIGEYNLILPRTTVIISGDRVVISEDRGDTTLHILIVPLRSEGATITCRCKEVDD